MKTYGGLELHLHAFLTWALVGDEWLVSRMLRRFYHRRKGRRLFIDKAVGGPQVLCGRGGQEKNP